MDFRITYTLEFLCEKEDEHLAVDSLRWCAVWSSVQGFRDRRVIKGLKCIK